MTERQKSYFTILLVSTLFFNCTSILVLAAKVTISGSSIQFRNQEISALVQLNPIFKRDSVICQAKFDSTGFFQLNFDLTETAIVNIPLGVYLCYLVVEPGSNYQVLLPPRKDLTKSDRLNPYFKPVQLHLALEKTDTTELNFLIRSFDDAWYPYFNRFARDIRSKTSKALIDSVVFELNKPYLSIKDTFFNQYKEYRIGMLLHLAYQQKSKAIWKQYFRQRPVLYNNPAYIELFHQVFERYFYYFSLSEYGKPLPTMINQRKSLTEVKKLLQTDEILAGSDLMELVLLKNLYDEFYRSEYSRNAIVDLLDSVSRTTKVLKHVSISNQIKDKITRLMPGFNAPFFSLPDINGKFYTFKDFEDKYLYINFCSCNSYSCLKEFNTLNTLYLTHKERLNIVTILVDEDRADIENFLKQSRYEWTFLLASSSPGVLEKYDIRAYPTYYFFDKDSKLLYSPSPSPSEGFGMKWYELLKKRKEVF